MSTIHQHNSDAIQLQKYFTGAYLQEVILASNFQLNITTKAIHQYQSTYDIHDQLTSQKTKRKKFTLIKETLPLTTSI
jgi:hypothetical protein